MQARYSLHQLQYLSAIIDTSAAKVSRRGMACQTTGSATSANWLQGAPLCACGASSLTCGRFAPLCLQATNAQSAVVKRQFEKKLKAAKVGLRDVTHLCSGCHWLQLCWEVERPQASAGTCWMSCASGQVHLC